MISTIAAFGYITWYVAAIGTPLFCGGVYDPSAAWLALPVEEYLSGRARCGDLYAVWVDGDLAFLPALDAGGFGDHCVLRADGCHDIPADLPQHLFRWCWRSRRGYVINSEPYRARLEIER